MPQKSNAISSLITSLSILAIQSLTMISRPLSALSDHHLLANIPLTAATANQTKYLNIACDFGAVGGGGCVLRESYCSYRTCVCKPDFPINVDNITCLDRYKKMGEMCTMDSECQGDGLICVKAMDNIKLKRCVCRPGFAFSVKNNDCIKGHKGSLCSKDVECTAEHSMCSASKCQCLSGYDFNQNDEMCYKKAKHNESCNATVNCRANDRLSECDKVRKVCVCRQSVTTKKVNALDVLTNKCIDCPLERFNNETKLCKPETLEIEYRNERSMITRHSLQYVYIALSVSPFVVFAIIGFLYKFVSPRSNSLNNLLHSGNNNNSGRNIHRNVFAGESPIVDSRNGHNTNNNRNDTNHSTLLINMGANDSHPLVCPPISPVLLNLIPPRDPPPSYEASQLMPPSYEEAIASQP